VNFLLVALGAVVGAPLRYLVDKWIQGLGDTVFPWGTLTVNSAACAVLGLVTGAALPDMSSDVQNLLGFGFCGALSTFSTFSYTTLRLAEDGHVPLAAANVAVTVTAGLGSAALGVAASDAWGLR
jgi:CrcB protein